MAPSGRGLGWVGLVYVNGRTFRDGARLGSKYAKSEPGVLSAFLCAINPLRERVWREGMESLMCILLHLAFAKCMAQLRIRGTNLHLQGVLSEW